MRQRRVAALGVIAILLQAILFGWHHHPLVWASAATPMVMAPIGPTPLSPATVATDCQICIVLRQLCAPPSDTALSLHPPPAVPSRAPIDAAFFAGAASLAFHARAPPRA